ncbi:OsmC family protein [Rhodococcus sp. NPDC127530]|uniref:OsmC family protein n=1 Tax=unclassified Rhodococcus (in: high G+C Gram-positive bacteria) TaxID=192944 RepID=UPI0036328B8C
MYVSTVRGRGTGVYHVAHGADLARPLRFDGHPAFGGSDRALGPFEHLLGALGACCQITADIVARSRRIKLGEMHTEIETSFDNSILVFGVAGTSKFDTLDIDITVDTSLSNAELEELGREVERRCPIIQLFVASGVRVRSSWKPL